MDELFSYQNKILDRTPLKWNRAAFSTIDWSQQLFGIKGLRGVGKTTMMLQYVKQNYEQSDRALYVTADNPWFYEHSLYELIEGWHKNGGRLLLIDEIHKYPRWARELKVGYDGHPDMQFVFSASSAFDIFKAETDLSRRATVVTLSGMSFREFLEFRHEISVPPYTIRDLIKDGEALSREINQKLQPIPLFKEYLETGYLPFSADEKEPFLQQKLMGIINTVLENDLAYVQDYSPANVQKIKKLLGVIAGSAPFTPNISKIAKKLSIGRKTVYNYLKHLDDAHILNLLHKPGRGVSVLQKPDKVYLENTNFAQTLDDSANIGSLRETFFVNQVRNAGHDIGLAKQGDFIVDEQLIFEVGGKNKGSRQIKGLDEAYLVLDDMEYAFRNKIPLWMFGLLY
jgi:predicted AAA+ superfamily ATPase